ncbi:Mitochondrial distribution and morphology protein 10 [Mycoemilia scoparia]|uniref:Mitochondrial distribution and morphology protein 10 n=1 Tax=Mycoemilia scoparia TaxID=417184 RepID=A0A9W8DUR0_9FUNG|nr:Mitochondrial distribution and morphology protein 10 [Mycoemilia scoparia]
MVVESIGWRLENQYSNIQKASQEILDFTPPKGLHITSEKSISDSFKSQYSYTILPSQAASVGYLSTSQPLAFYVKKQIPNDLDDQPFPTKYYGTPSNGSPAEAFMSLSNLLSGIRDSSWRTDFKMFDKSWRERRQKSTIGDYLMMAQMYPGNRSITGQYACRIRPNSLLYIKGLSIASDRQNLQLVTHFIQDRKGWCTEYSFSSHGAIFGIHGMYSFGDCERVDETVNTFIHGSKKCRADIYNRGLNGKVSIGGEAYVGLHNTSVGASFGIRYRHHIPLFAELSCVTNPLMGHVALSYVQDIRPDITTAVRYKLNYYSLRSDISVGTEWRSGDKSILKTSIGTDKGLQLLLDTRLRNIITTIGVGVDHRPKAYKGMDESAEKSLPPKLSFGLEFQFFV